MRETPRELTPLEQKASDWLDDATALATTLFPESGPAHRSSRRALRRLWLKVAAAWDRLQAELKEEEEERAA